MILCVARGALGVDEARGFEAWVVVDEDHEADGALLDRLLALDALRLGAWGELGSEDF
jgi:hypothetical protein